MRGGGGRSAAARVGRVLASRPLPPLLSGAPEPQVRLRSPGAGDRGLGDGVDPVGVSFFSFLGSRAVRFSRAITAWCGLGLFTPHREFYIPG